MEKYNRHEDSGVRIQEDDVNGTMMQKYIDMALDLGALEAVAISPADVVTAAWVSHKCKFGCDKYGLNRCCPPNSPTWKETREILDCYETGLLVRDPGWGTSDIVRQISRAMFFDGYYKAMAFGAGFCTECEECLMGKCPNKMKVFPSMEACGIDVFATVRKYRLPVQVLPNPGCDHNAYGLVLMD